MFHLATYS